MSNLIKKVTVKTVFGDPKKYIRDNGLKASVAIVRIVGIATRLVTGESDYGPWVKFKGNFKATNLLTGEEFRSGSCLMPEVASDLVEGAMCGEGVDGVNFAFDILLVPDDSSATGYVYQAEPLIDYTESDPLALLESQVAARLDAPAPEKGKGKKAEKADA